MNPYALLPLIGFCANFVLALYILKKNAADLTNRLYSLAALSLAIWSIGDYFSFSALSLQVAFWGDKISSLGSSLTVFFLLYFFLQYTDAENKIIANKLFTILLFLPTILFIISDFLFNTISKSIRAGWWGYSGIKGDFFLLFVFYLVAYIAIGIFLCYKFYIKTKLPNEKKQARLMIIAMSIPLGGGILTEVIPQIFNFEMIPLTSALTTCTALIIAYAMAKYQLMDIVPAIAANTIIETLTDSLFVLGQDKTILQVNQSTCDFLGYKRKDLLGQPVNLLFDSQSLGLEDTFVELLSYGKIYNHKLIYLTKARKKIAISLNASIIKNPEGKLLGIIGIARDITKQEKTEAEIKDKNRSIEKQNQAILNILEDISEEKNNIAQERDKNNTILQSIGDGVIVVDNKQKIIFLNPIAEELTGWNLKQAGGEDLEKVFSIFDERTNKRRENPINAAILKGEITKLANHTIIRRKDGQVIPISDSAAPIKDVKGNINGAVLVFRDVINERIAEEKIILAKNNLEELNKELDIKVEQKTKELQKAFAELKSLDEMKDEFLNISAHELKTPLTSIIGLSELIIMKKQGNITVLQKKSLTIVNNEANRLLTIIKKILSVTRIEAKKAIFNIQDINPCEILPNVVESLKIVAKNTKVQIICNRPKNEYLVKADPERLQEVVYNLIDNALKFSPENSKIFVSGEIKGKKFIFNVKDQGPGIDPAQKDKLFQKFSQLDTGFSRKQEGTGLGLYICKIIIDNMNGKIWAESELGKGATFKFSLPLAKQVK